MCGNIKFVRFEKNDERNKKKKIMQKISQIIDLGLE